VENVRELSRKIKVGAPLVFDEPLEKHTSFRIGGPADAYAVPRTADEIRELTSLSAEAGIPCFILGGGSNILVSDLGIRGLVMDMSALRGIQAEEDGLSAEGGALMEEACGFALSRGLGGLAFAAGLPGSVGGAVWMNARCYERSVSDILAQAEVLDADGVVRTVPLIPSQWGYKRSPFQKRGGVILRARFRLEPGDPEKIRAEMRERRADREAKGHFLHPSAGSVFKNNRDFGAPTGRLIDSLGLKGRRIGDAAVAPFHGNIIVNLGKATARDVLSLILLVEAEVKTKLGFDLEREILLAGEWRAA
jgi:UDP-N-acetylmuramate dehydrogenase